MNERSFLAKLFRRCPKNFSEVWDFPGYQYGKKHLEREIKKVLLCLDFTEDVLEKAEEYRPDIIITHHPFFFGKMKDILAADARKIYLCHEIDTLDCPIYSFHTNFDKIKGGMNDTLISMLGGGDIKVYKDDLLRNFKIDGVDEFDKIVELVAATYSLPYLQYYKCNDKKIDSICMIAGGGASEFMNAIDMKADLYISGDASHHTRLDIKRYNLNYIELPHEVEEIGFLKGMSKMIMDIEPSLDIERFAFEKFYSLYERR